LDAERVGHAADLHERSTGDVGRVIGLPTGGDECGRLGTRIVAAHQRLAHQGGVEPERPPAPDRRCVADARLGDDDAVVGDDGSQPIRPLRVDLEGSKVPVVDADQARVGRQRGVQLGLVVRLDQRFEAKLERLPHEGRQGVGGMEDRQQEDDVGTRGAHHRYLPRVDDEFLGQDRDGNGGADAPQVVDRTAEPVRLA
jgi:hypothetical protein